MPIYEYRCPNCGNEFELRRPFSSADEPASCPKCGKNAEKLLSAFASKVDNYLKAPKKPPLRNPPGGKGSNPL